MGKQVYQLKITLNEIEPPIWRRIQIPGSYNFWELHCAIQDAFGWENAHLHSFTCADGSLDGAVEIGIPLQPESHDDELPLAGWEHKVKEYLTGETGRLHYTYDFGDNWRHTIELELVAPAEKGVKYPRCLAGERACPPEDCGGPVGYDGLLEVLFNPKDPDYDEVITWVESVKGGEFHPEEFNPANVTFVSPSKRFKQCFESAPD